MTFILIALNQWVEWVVFHNCTRITAVKHHVQVLDFVNQHLV